jgi:hypothetical protein
MKRRAVLIVQERTSGSAVPVRANGVRAEHQGHASLPSAFCYKTEWTDAAVARRDVGKAAGRVGERGSACGRGRRMESGDTRRLGSSARGPRRVVRGRAGRRGRGGTLVERGWPGRGLGLGRRALIFEGRCKRDRTAPTRRMHAARVSEESPCEAKVPCGW